MALQSPLRDKIITAAIDAQRSATDAKELSALAVKRAHDCGRMLLAEKIWLLEVRDKAREKLKLLKENSQPATPAETFWKDADWPTWFDAQYSKTIQLDLADKFVRLAKTHENQTTFQFDHDPNVMRSGLLALAIYPMKVHETVEGDVPLQKSASHLALINRFALWVSTWKKKHRSEISIDDRLRLLADLSPVCVFIDELRAGSNVMQ